MSEFKKLISPGLDSLNKYILRLTDDIEESQFSSFPRTKSGEIINIIHPAFCIGHLATYPKKIFSLLDLDPASLSVPNSYYELFLKGKDCKDDQDNSYYPLKEELLDNYFKGMDIALKSLDNIKIDFLLTENPLEAARERFPTRGAFITYLFSAHISGHLGQISSWRRCMGMNSV